MPTTEVDPRAFAQLGEVTARLHQHSRKWQSPAGFRRIAVQDSETMVGARGHWGHWQYAPGLTAAGFPLIEETLAHTGSVLKSYGKNAQRYGLIHADLRLTNLLPYKGETRVIDFDDCGMGWYSTMRRRQSALSNIIRGHRSGSTTGWRAMNGVPPMMPIWR